MIPIKYVINNIEFVISTCISVLAIIVSAVIKRYDLFREFVADHRLNTINKYEYLIKKINTKKHRSKLLESTIEFNKFKISIELPDFEELMDDIIQDTKICQNILLETNKLEENPLTTDDDRINYMNRKIESELKKYFFQKEIVMRSYIIKCHTQ